MRLTGRQAVLALVAAFAVAATLLTRSCSDGDAARSPDAPRPTAPAPSSAAKAPPPRVQVDDERRPRGFEATPLGQTEAAPIARTAAPEPAKLLRIHGRILDERGVGVGGAKFEMRAWSGAGPHAETFTFHGTADANGTFEMNIVAAAAAAGFGIETTAPGHVDGWKSVKPDAYDESRGVDIVVEPARAIVGRVLDADRRAVPGTTVMLWYGSETTWPTQADAEGRFRCPPHAPQRDFELIVEAPGYARRRIPVPAAREEETDAGDIVLRRGGRIAGVAVDQQGRPVQDLWVALDTVSTNDAPAPRARTDTNGRFTFESVDEGDVDVSVDTKDSEGGPAGSRRHYTGVLHGVKAGRDDLRLTVSAWARVWLRFVDADTRDPVNLRTAEYGFRYAGTPEPARLGQGASAASLTSTVLSAESGRRYDLTVRSPGYEDARVDDLELGDVAEMTVDVPMRAAR